MASKYGPKGQGAIWPHEKKGDKHPDYRGHVKITLEQLEALVSQAKSTSEEEFTLEIAMWDRTSKNGDEYKFISTEVSIPQEAKHEEFRRPTAPKRPWD